MTGSADLYGILHQAKVQAFGDTFSDASRLQAVIDTIFAVVAFNDFSAFRMPLGGSPGAGRDARFTAHAYGSIHEDNAIFGALLHGTGGAGGHTPGLFAMKAGHKYVGHTRQVVDELGAHGNDLVQSGADGQVFAGFAMHFTAIASNTTFGILKNIVLTHWFASAAPCLDCF